MLTHQEALSCILQNAKTLGAVVVPLPGALGNVLSENVKANLPFPHFDNSAVDGFAVRLKKRGQILRSAQDDKVFKFKGEVPAGETRNTFLNPGEAMAVFTGAPVPEGSQSVIMQEFAERRNGSVLIQKPVDPSANIRRQGEDFKKGDLLISKGTCLEPQHLALLAALGHGKVTVFRRPRAAVFATGSEIILPGKKLKRGQIYDSNTPLLEALIKKTGAHPVLMSKENDGLAAIRRAIRKGLRQDVLIVCGGVSVGKYDFVKEALRREGVREIFWKINIKPGKPVFFGRKGKTLVFGLPGNPVSVFVTFEAFVKPALLKMMGKKTQPPGMDGFLSKSFQNGSRPQFVRVSCRKGKGHYEITPLKGQGSHQIGSLSRAHGILKVEAGEMIPAGRKVCIQAISEDF